MSNAFRYRSNALYFSCLHYIYHYNIHQHGKRRRGIDTNNKPTTNRQKQVNDTPTANEAGRPASSDLGEQQTKTDGADRRTNISTPQQHCTLVYIPSYCYCIDTHQEIEPMPYTTTRLIDIGFGHVFFPSSANPQVADVHMSERSSALR
jgi:hypothetical protein